MTPLQTTPSFLAIPKEARPKQKTTGYFSADKHFYMPLAPYREPSFLPGQRFFCWHDVQCLTGPNGQHISSHEVEFKILVLREVHSDNLILTTEDRRSTYLLPLSIQLTDPANLPENIYFVLDDAECATLRKKYEGRSLYSFPGFNLYGWAQYTNTDASYGFKKGKLQRLIRIRRAAPFSLGINGLPFDSYDPIIALFEPEEGVVFPDVDEVTLWNTSPDERNIFHFDYPSQFYAYFAGAWDMERAVSFQGDAHPATVGETFTIALVPFEKGMTQDRVIWLEGYPSVYGTREQLRRLETWIYNYPDRDVLIRFKKGRVTGWKVKPKPYMPWNPP